MNIVLWKSGSLSNCFPGYFPFMLSTISSLENPISTISSLENPIWVWNPIIWYQSRSIFLGLMATKKMEDIIEMIEERIIRIHGEMASTKGDLQKLVPLEVKLDDMLEKLSMLGRMEQMMQKWELSEKE